MDRQERAGPATENWVESYCSDFGGNSALNKVVTIHMKMKEWDQEILSTLSNNHRIHILFKLIWNTHQDRPLSGYKSHLSKFKGMEII